MKPAALFTLDTQNTQPRAPLQQAALAEEIIFLFRMENLVAAHERELQMGIPDPPDDAMDYFEVEALIEALQQKPVLPEEVAPIIMLHQKNNTYKEYKQKTVWWVIAGAVMSVALLWLIWKIAAWIHFR